MKTRGEHKLRDDFELSEKTLAWIEKKYPAIDIQETVERFKDWAMQKGVMYADWQAGFKTVVRKGMDNGWRSIVTIKGGKAFDQKWQAILHEARKHGFREPTHTESPGVYKTALELWRQQQQRKNVVTFDEWKAQQRKQA